MKKILVTLAIFAVVGSTMFAQNTKITASNEIYSETVYKEANGDDPMADRGAVRRGFWGFRETAMGKVDTETWTLQARLRVWLWSLGKTSNYATDGMGNKPGQSVHGDNWENVFFNDKNRKNVRVNFWYRPLAGIEMGIGNDFDDYYQMPAGNMIGIDRVMGYMINSEEFSFAPADARIFEGNQAAGARWANDGFALNITKVPNLLVSVNIPFMAVVDEYDFAPAINAAAHYNVGSNVNIGVAYHGGINQQYGHVLGVYGQFKNDIVRIPLGLTVGFKARPNQTWVTDPDKARMEIDFAPDFTFRNGMQLGASLSLAIMFGAKYDATSDDPNINNVGLKGRGVMPLVIGLYYKWPINNAWTFDVRTWFELALGTGLSYTINNVKFYYYDDIKGTAGQWYFEPKISYKINAHNEVFAGFKLRFNFVMGDQKDTRNNYMGYAVPIGWKWTL